MHPSGEGLAGQELAGQGLCTWKECCVAIEGVAKGGDSVGPGWLCTLSIILLQHCLLFGVVFSGLLVLRMLG